MHSVSLAMVIKNLIAIQELKNDDLSNLEIWKAGGKGLVLDMKGAKDITVKTIDVKSKQFIIKFRRKCGIDDKKLKIMVDSVNSINFLLPLLILAKNKFVIEPIGPIPDIIILPVPINPVVNIDKTIDYKVAEEYRIMLTDLFKISIQPFAKAVPKVLTYHFLENLKLLFRTSFEKDCLLMMDNLLGGYWPFGYREVNDFAEKQLAILKECFYVIERKM